jgi:hypothetical protein
MMTAIVAAAGYAFVMLGTFALDSGTPDPSATLLVNGAGFTLLSMSLICIVAVGFAALTASKPAALTVLIGWQLVASPLIGNISSLGSSRKLLLNQATNHFSPVHIGDHGGDVAMGQTTALLVLIGWLVLFTALGAWRTRTMDA